jgi:hypothetical protein
MTTQRALFVAIIFAAGARAEVPYPSCAAKACGDPKDFASYLFLRRGEIPNDFDPRSSDSWKYKPFIGVNVLGAWRISTGRPDVFFPGRSPSRGNSRSARGRRPRL